MKNFKEKTKKYIYKNQLKKEIPWNTLLAYLVFSSLWIVFSDRIVASFFNDIELINKIQTLKGVVFIVLTTGIIGGLFRVDYRKMIELNEEISNQNRELENSSAKLMLIENELQSQLDTLNVKNTLIEDIFKNSNTGILIWNSEGVVVEVNDCFLSISNYSKEEIIGKDWHEIVKIQEDQMDYMTLLYENKYIKNHVVQFIGKNRKIKDVMWSATASRYEENEEFMYISFWIDITAEKVNERLLYNIAYTDKLTGLRNKSVFEAAISVLIQKHKPFTLFYLDLDDFKNLNEFYGYSMGDKIIYQYAMKLKELFGESNVYRWSGDEFIIVGKFNNSEKIKHVVNQIMKETANVWNCEGIDYYLSVSMGITSYPQDGNKGERFISNMDIALYKAKLLGKNKVVKYEPAFQEMIEERIEIDNRINEAINNDGFELYYQPIYILEDMKLKGMEVLLRWKNNPLNISTEKLIRVAEETGQILKIDRMVIRGVFKCVEKHLKDDDFSMSINLSAKTVESPGLVDYIDLCLEDTPIDTSRIIFELTEHSLINKLENTQKLISELKSRGFSFSLDDFGTGHSSLNYLTKLDFDYLKIDRSYISNITEISKNRLLVEQIIALAQNLGMEIVAEGIETLEQRDMLFEMGCEYGQGYFMAKPMDKQCMLELLIEK